MEPTAPAGKPSNMIVRLGVLMFLAAVILGECILAFVLISKSGAEGAVAAEVSQTADAHAEKAEPEHGKAEHGKSSHGESGHGESKEAAGQDEGDEFAGDNVEIDLEQFAVTSHQVASDTTLRVEFHLYGIVAADDKEEFEKRLKANQQRFREQVLVTVRSAEPADLAEAELGLIKRQILEKTNALLGKPLLKTVIITDFSHFQQ